MLVRLIVVSKTHGVLLCIIGSRQIQQVWLFIEADRIIQPFHV